MAKNSPKAQSKPKPIANVPTLDQDSRDAVKRSFEKKGRTNKWSKSADEVRKQKP
jgi:hypothetical protein